MSKFNLKKKLNLDETITKRLSVDHDEAPQVITEKQLDGDRIPEKEVILEKLLDSKRTGSADRIIEKNLNDTKGQFGPLRNPKTYNGNINKIEEKRLAGDKTEDEKYEAASTTPKIQRWWDHLKQSSSSKAVRVAARPVLLDSWGEQDAWKELEDQTRGQEPEEGLIPDRDPSNEFMGNLKDSEIDTETDPLTSKMDIVKHRESKNPIPAVYFSLEFDPFDFDDNIEEAKLAAMEKILELNPNLEGKISPDDIKPTLKGGIEVPGQFSVRLIGPEYFSSDNKKMLSGLSIEQVDVGGTPVIVGKLNVGPQAKVMDHEALIKAISDYVTQQDDSIDITALENSLNLSAIDSGEVTFAIGAPSEQDNDEDNDEDNEVYQGEVLDDTIEDEPIDDMVTEESFPVNDVNSQEGIVPLETEIPAPTPEEKRIEEIRKREKALAKTDFPIIIADIKKK